jgi:hypothetical protein
MNKATSRYPIDWKEIALNIKEREGWHCYRCGILGLRPGERLYSPKQRGSILEGQGGLALIVEHHLPPPAMRRKPLPVQLGLFGNYSRYRQLELWDWQKVVK